MLIAAAREWGSAVAKDASASWLIAAARVSAVAIDDEASWLIAAEKESAVAKDAAASWRRSGWREC